MMSTKSDMGEIIDQHTIEVADDITGIIICACGESGAIEEHPWHVAGCLRAEGWTKTQRVITTTEELDALVKMSVVLDAECAAFQLCGMDNFGKTWACLGDIFGTSEITLPATVLYEPTP